MKSRCSCCYDDQGGILDTDPYCRVHGADSAERINLGRDDIFDDYTGPNPNGKYPCEEEGVGRCGCPIHKGEDCNPVPFIDPSIGYRHVDRGTFREPRRGEQYLNGNSLARGEIFIMAPVSRFDPEFHTQKRWIVERIPT